jgi:hypothetical protein
MIYEFNIPLPDHVRFGSLYLQHNGVWSLGVRAAYELLDPHGSSLGGVVATGYGATVDEARIQALDKLQSQLREAHSRPASDPPRLQSHSRLNRSGHSETFKGKSVEDILATLGVPTVRKEQKTGQKPE